jgi:hypothetical protein
MSYANHSPSPSQVCESRQQSMTIELTNHNILGILMEVKDLIIADELTCCIICSFINIIEHPAYYRKRSEVRASIE